LNIADVYKSKFIISEMITSFEIGAVLTGCTVLDEENKSEKQKQQISPFRDLLRDVRLVSCA
jgi:hypothetical protein